MGVTRTFSFTSSTLTKGIMETAVHRGFHSRWTVRCSRRGEAIGTSSDDIQTQLPVVTRDSRAGVAAGSTLRNAPGDAAFQGTINGMGSRSAPPLPVSRLHV